MNRYLAALVVLVALGAAACGDDDAPVDAAPVPDGAPPRGTISLSWSVESGGSPAACADVGAQFVTMEIVEQGSGAGVPETLNCTAGEATTREIGIGTYNVDMDLVDQAGQSLLAAPVREIGVEVTEGSDTPIGAIVFQVE